MIKYIHGSEDSTDIDVFYVFDKLPDTIQECKTFCCADPNENRNIIVINDGVVTDCYKGTPDEVNNALLRTYDLHDQQYPLLVTREVKRDMTIKIIRSIRIILSHISRCSFRQYVKQALSSGFKKKLLTLYTINFERIDFAKLNPKMSREDILKVIAFQMGQTMALIHGAELYTKKEIALYYPILKPFLYRDKNSDISELENFKRCFLDHVNNMIQYEGEGETITCEGTTYNVKKETKI